jgi:hypothetical protein
MVRLCIQNAPRHRSAHLDVKDLGETLRIVAGHNDVRSANFVEDIFARQQAFGQPRIGQG